MSPQIKKYCWAHFAAGKNRAPRDFFFPSNSHRTQRVLSNWKTKSLPFKTQFQMHASPMHFSSSKHQHLCLTFIQSSGRNSSENCKTFLGHKYVCPVGVPILQCCYVHIFCSYSSIPNIFSPFLAYIMKYKLSFSTFTYLVLLIFPH